MLHGVLAPWSACSLLPSTRLRLHRRGGPSFRASPRAARTHPWIVLGLRSLNRCAAQAGQSYASRNDVGDVVLALLGVVVDCVLQDETVERGDEEPY